MQSQSPLLTIVVGVFVFAGAFVALKRFNAVEPAPEPPGLLQAEPQPAAAGDKKAAEKAPERAPEKAPEKKPDALAPPPNPVVRRWTVAPVGQEVKFGFRPRTMAVGNDGTRVLVRASDDVVAFEVGRSAPRRFALKPLQTALVAPDALRYHLSHDKTGLETLDGTGTRVGLWQPANPKSVGGNWFDLVGTHPTTGRLVAVVRNAVPGGLYEIVPETGEGKLVVPFAETEYLHGCRGIFPQADGTCLIHVHPVGKSQFHPGVYRLQSDGKLNPTPLILDDAKKSGLGHLAVSADGRYLAFSEGRSVKVWDVRAGRALFTWELQYYYPVACRFWGGRLVIKAESDYDKVTKLSIGIEASRTELPGLFQVYDVGSRELLGQLRPSDYNAQASAFAFSPNGRYLAVAGAQQVTVFDSYAAFGLSR